MGLAEIIREWLLQHELFRYLSCLEAANGAIVIHFLPRVNDAYDINVDMWVVSIMGDTVWGPHAWETSDPRNPKYFEHLEAVMLHRLAGLGYDPSTDMHTSLL